MLVDLEIDQRASMATPHNREQDRRDERASPDGGAARAFGGVAIAVTPN